MADTTRVLVIGVDAATFDLIEPWVAAGHLPNLARLMASGSCGRLQSTLQPATAPAWVTFMTGVNQGRHGLYDFVRRRADSYAVEVTNSSHVGAPTLFELLSQAGKRVISVNVPYTSPPRPINGIMVGGPFAPAMTPDMVYPPAYYETLRQIVPDYFVLPEYKAQAADPLGDLAGRLLAEIDQRERLSRHLLRTEAWDLFMVVFMATDEAQHTFWSAMQAEATDPLARYRHVIRSVYERADQAIGALLAEARAEDGTEPAVIVLSDHGAGPFHAMINLNHWLAQAGYFAFRTDAASPVLRGSSDMLRRLAHAYRRYLPARLRALIRSRLGARGFDRVKGEFETALVTTAVDWGQTQAYALGVGGNLYINLRGREPQGIVAPGAEYDAVRQAISHKLASLRDPQTQALVVRRVYRREELYHGQYLDRAPDLIVEWADYAYWGRASYEKPATPIFQDQRFFDFSDQPLSGCHRPQGILIGHGPRIRAGASIVDAHLPDVTLAVLDLLNVVPVRPLDGRPATGWLLPDASLDPAHPVETTAPELGPAQEFTPEEAQLIADHLRALGYL